MLTWRTPDVGVVLLAISAKRAIRNKTAETCKVVAGRVLPTVLAVVASIMRKMPFGVASVHRGWLYGVGNVGALLN